MRFWLWVFRIRFRGIIQCMQPISVMDCASSTSDRRSKRLITVCQNILTFIMQPYFEMLTHYISVELRSAVHIPKKIVNMISLKMRLTSFLPLNSTYQYISFWMSFSEGKTILSKVTSCTYQACASNIEKVYE